MECPKCKSIVEEGSVFCNKCGCRIIESQTMTADEFSKALYQSEERKKVENAKHKIKSGFLLNIFSLTSLIIGFTILCILAEPVTDNSVNAEYSNGSSISVEVIETFSIDEILLLVFTITYFVDIVLGFIVYLIKKDKIKTILSYIYIVLSMITALSSMPYFIFIGIPIILQVIAGIKFVSGARNLKSLKYE